jgi:beta-mannosidase
MVDNIEASGIQLCAGWNVSRIGGSEELTIDFPCDIHSALFAHGMIEDPYWRDREPAMDWIHESEWCATKRFRFDGDKTAQHILRLDNVDCHAIVRLNGQDVGNLGNRFRRYDLDVTTALRKGENTLTIVFLSNSELATQKAKDFPFPVPYVAQNNRLPNYNFLRKTQCDAGWDWNIALSPLGIYGDIRLIRSDPYYLDDLMVRQQHGQGKVDVTVGLAIVACDVAVAPVKISVGEHNADAEIRLYPGANHHELTITIDAPKLWWPIGHGAQDMYEATVQVGSQKQDLQIGLRTVELITEPDQIGNRFAFRVNGREIFMRGANWIPADALPARATPEVVADLLDSAVDANMNMLRVWGGGCYEPDWFYQMCSERGLLVWQDFMFSCNLYPASDRAWLNDVKIEARQQVRRLSKHACLALWCGDNELVGALTWYEESLADRDRYLAMYDRLNHALEEVVADEAPDVPWWPSSPSVGALNFGDGWHDDTSGDMHFWDVWHSAKDFEHYRTVQPRFCSEFGFQSFPSPRLIETFTEPEDRNVSSAVMDVHQRNDGGNSRIVETLARYFRFPDNFDEMCWLSQVSQGLAMKTAIEFWRSSKPRCMGTLFWQLNDTWPVASWASLEYGGVWKLTQYLAKRFFDPVLVTAQPDVDSGDILIWAINDTPVPVDLTVTARRVDFEGPVSKIGSWQATCRTDGAQLIARLPGSDLGAQEFLYLDWKDADRTHVGANEYLPKRPKAYHISQPKIEMSVEDENIILLTDKPALFVTYGHGNSDIYSDNCVTLLPGHPKKLTRVRKRTDHPETENLRWLKG